MQARRTVDPLWRIRKTLRAHYREKRRLYGLDRRKAYDEDLLRLFTAPPAIATGPPPPPSCRATVRSVTGGSRGRRGVSIHDRPPAQEHHHPRCRQLGLRLSRSE